MRFLAVHTTRFRYSEPVFLEPHAVRLRPRSDSAQRLLRYRLEIEPEPSVLSEASDAEGNSLTHAWFSGTTDALTLRSEFDVETLRENPFDYIILDDGAKHLPMSYPDDLRNLLAPSLACSSAASDRLRDLVASVVDQADRQTLPFLMALNERIFATYTVTIRLHGDPLAADETLRRTHAACRDLAVLFMECCRLAGIASRFVSGYRETRADPDTRYMHAWAEVYLPGGGWRGYDPTQGLAVADRHVAVAASASPPLAAPLHGTYRGGTVAAPIEVEISITACEPGRRPSIGDTAGPPSG